MIYLTLPPQKYLNERLDYDPKTGILRWRKTPLSPFNPYAGQVAGSVTDGHVIVKLDGVIYFAHRLIWKMVYGEDPPRQVDHRNWIGTDNRLSNLRLATHCQNKQNAKTPITNTTGYRGVFVKRGRKRDKYFTQVQANRVVHYLGTYDTPEETHAVYLDAVHRLHGEYAFDARDANA